MSERLADTVAIVGVGLIGGSIGMAVKARGLARRVIGIGRDPRKLHRAQQLAAVDDVTTDMRVGAAEADLIFVCTPVLTIIPTIDAIAGSLCEGAVVTDVGSTKTEIARAAESVMPDGRYFVGGHPMAGSEASGVEAAVPYLFLDATYVLTPTASTPVRALQTMVGFAERIGAKVLLMSPEEHDRSAAIISHLPHILSAAILRLAADEQARSGKVFQLAAGSFRDMTRVAASPPEIWRDICLSSRDAITAALGRFEEILRQVRGQIEALDAESVEKLFSDARELKKTWLDRKPAEDE